MSNSNERSTELFDRAEQLLAITDSYLHFAAYFSTIYYELPMDERAREKAIAGIRETLDALMRGVDAVVSSITLLEATGRLDPNPPLPIWEVKGRQGG